MTKKKIEIININEADIVRLYPDSEAPKLAGIMGIQYSDDAQNFFQTMRSVVMIYIYLHNREQNLEVSKEYKKAKTMIAHIDKLISSAEDYGSSNKDSFNIAVALEKQWALKKPSVENNTLTADINMTDAKGQSSWMVEGHPSASGWQSLLFHGKVGELGKILTNPDDALEDHLTNLKIMRQQACVDLKELEIRKSDRTRNFAIRQVIVLIRDEYEKLPGKRATLSNTRAGKGASGIFMNLVKAVLEPVLPPYWEDKRLESVIRSVLHPKPKKTSKKGEDSKNIDKKSTK
jgi:hypothetical protein